MRRPLRRALRRLYGALLESAFVFAALVVRLLEQFSGSGQRRSSGGRGAFGALVGALGAPRARGTSGARGVPVRVLVLRFGLLGDGTALLSPTLQRLRQTLPGATIHVLATPLQRPLLQGLPFVDEVLSWDAGDLTEPRQALRPAAWRAAWVAIREVRRRDYDLALAVYGRLAAAVALLSGASRRLGYAGEAFPLSLTDALPGKRYDRPGWHEADYGVALVDLAAGQQQDGLPITEQPRSEHEQSRSGQPAREYAGAGAPPTESPRTKLCVSSAGRTELAGLLASLPGGAPRAPAAPGAPGAPKALVAPGAPGVPGAPGAPVVVLHPGATNGRAKRWPVPHWIALAGRLREAGTTVVLAGGPESRALSGAIREGAGAGILDVTGRTSLPALLALLEGADVFVSGDSGPLHLAVALGRPVVAIHGPTDPGQSGPYRAERERAIVVRHDLPCSPCYSLDRVAECPLGHTLCQWLVTPDQVYGAVRTLLGSPSPTGSQRPHPQPPPQGGGSSMPPAGKGGAEAPHETPLPRPGGAASAGLHGGDRRGRGCDPDAPETRTRQSGAPLHSPTRSPAPLSRREADSPPMQLGHSSCD